MLQTMKKALRISHNLLDDVIQADIETARAEMVRAGVSVEVAADDDNRLVQSCIKAFVMAMETDDAKLQEGYMNSFKYQLDNIRKSEVVMNV